MMEKELICLLLDGHKVGEIAGLRQVESSTINKQINGLFRKFGCSRTKDIIKYD